MKKLLLTLTILALSYQGNAQWTTQNTGFLAPTRGLDYIQILDANNVWATAYDGTGGGANVQEFTRTTDGGTTWTPGFIDVGDATAGISNLIATSSTTAWVGVYPTANGGFNGVSKTEDGGLTWTSQTLPGYTDAASFVDGIHFFDANTGVVFGDPITSSTTFEMYRTTDGGSNWNAVSSPAITNGDYGYAGLFATYGDAMWFGTAKGKIYRTLDKGATWTKLNSPIGDFGNSLVAKSGTLYFSDVNNGILMVRNMSAVSNGTNSPTVVSRTIYRTTNGGTTWSTGTTYTSPYNGNISYIHGTTKLIGTGVTGTGATAVYSVGTSTDNGATWTDIETGTQRVTINFLNDTTGWAGGFNQDEFTGGIFKYTGNLSKVDFSKTNYFKVYPNPANTIITVSVKDTDSYKLKMVDITGKVIFEKQYSGVENSIDISNVNSGVYFLTFIADGKSETTKIIKN